MRSAVEYREKIPTHFAFFPSDTHNSPTKIGRGKDRRGWAVHPLYFWSLKAIIFLSKHTIKLCVSCSWRCPWPPHLARHTWQSHCIYEVLKTTYKARLRGTLQGCHASSKSPSRVRVRELLGRTDENISVSPTWGHRFGLLIDGRFILPNRPPPKISLHLPACTY